MTLYYVRLISGKKRLPVPSGKCDAAPARACGGVPNAVVVRASLVGVVGEQCGKHGGNRTAKLVPRLTDIARSRWRRRRAR